MNHVIVSQVLGLQGGIQTASRPSIIGWLADTDAVPGVQYHDTTVVEVQRCAFNMAAKEKGSHVCTAIMASRG